MFQEQTKVTKRRHSAVVKNLVRLNEEVLTFWGPSNLFSIQQKLGGLEEVVRVLPTTLVDIALKMSSRSTKTSRYAKYFSQMYKAKWE